MNNDQHEIPIQPVEQPILCSPYNEPDAHWVYDTETGEASQHPGRREAGYWYKTQRTGTEQLQMRFVQEEERDDLPLVNALRSDVRRWRESNYRNVTNVTRELLRHWTREDRERRLFFCQREAVETTIWLVEIRRAGKPTGFKPQFTDDDLNKLIDSSEIEDLPALIRYGCKMATGSGKTVVMAMLIAWAFCNRGKVPSDERFPRAALVVCPNLTIKERLQVLRPDTSENYYDEFELIPTKLRPLLNSGKSEEQTRDEYYRTTHIQAIKFEIARQIVLNLVGGGDFQPDHRSSPELRLQSRHRLFPQVYRLVDTYVETRVDYHACHPCEIGQEKYLVRIVERLIAAIQPDETQGEPPLLPILNRYKPIGTSADVDFMTTRACHSTECSHVNQVVLDTQTWESSATFRLEQSDVVDYYVRNDHLGLSIPYEYTGVSHNYEPDFIVRLKNDINLVLEIKGFEADQERAKYAGANRWVSAVNNWGQLGQWAFHVCRNPQLLAEELDVMV